MFRGILASHRRALILAREAGEPAGQVAARELEIGRVEGARRRADELTRQVVAAPTS